MRYLLSALLTLSISIPSFSATREFVYEDKGNWNIGSNYAFMGSKITDSGEQLIATLNSGEFKGCIDKLSIKNEKSGKGELLCTVSVKVKNEAGKTKKVEFSQAGAILYSSFVSQALIAPFIVARSLAKSQCRNVSNTDLAELYKAANARSAFCE